MTTPQKDKIILLRGKGESYARIAAALNISENTVKSFCRRNNLGKDSITTDDTQNPLICKQCGNELIQTLGRKQRLFCTFNCRMAWWKANPEHITRKAVYSFVCLFCKKEFTVYGNKNRKYCSHACYISTRFGDTAKAGEQP